MSASDRDTIMVECTASWRVAVPSVFRLAALLLACVAAPGCSDGPGPDPDAGVLDAGVDGGGDAGVDGGVDSSVDAASADSDTLDAGDLGALADSGSEDLGGDASSDQGVDLGAMDQGPIACDLVSGDPCQEPLRCTLVNDISTGMNTIQCAEAGAGQELDACDRLNGGVDNCGAGLVCITGVCMAPCAEVDGVCEAGATCRLFAFGDGALGFCSANCDPVTQLRDRDDMLCSAGNSTHACFAAPDGTCHREQHPTRTQGVVVQPPVFSDSCAGGFRPIQYQLPATSTQCTAFCSPLETHVGQQAGVAGAPPFACPDRGADAPHECRFSHWLNPSPSASGDQVGVCVDPTRMTYDHDADPDTARINYPSCTTLPNTDTDGDGIAQHVQFGCGPRGG